MKAWRKPISDGGRCHALAAQLERVAIVLPCDLDIATRRCFYVGGVGLVTIAGKACDPGARAIAESCGH